MKNLLSFAFVFFFGIGLVVAQNTENTIPAVNVKSTEGLTVSTASFSNDGKPIIISFWATWCKPCLKELKAISEDYEEWQDSTGVKLIAISIDDARNSSRVLPVVNTFGWEFEVYLDKNQDFKRAMNVNNVPHTFLINGEGKIVYQHTSYTEGDEVELYEKVKKIAAGESLD